ncbi:MAG: glycosylase [Bacteroidetes bacterium]|nr:glycosylase [Bacteroidota bacterium]
MKTKFLLAIIFLQVVLSCQTGKTINDKKVVSLQEMESIFLEINTPFKYGIVFKHPDTTKMIDSPTIFRHNDKWLMSYIIYDGQGYETWLSESNNLLDWTSKGRLLSFTENTWDANQKAGYMALVDINWGGSYKAKKYEGKYWMSYLGGATEGYEKGTLAVGMASTFSLDSAHEWTRVKTPVLQPDDKDGRWFEKNKIYKSSVIYDSLKLTGYPYVMYYNAKGKKTDKADFESIGMAVSDDLVNWNRLGDDPVITHNEGICGDAQITKIGDIYVMFYFGAFWKPGAFERFACSYDLVNWTEWQGDDLIAPSENYDEKYAHKPWVIKWDGIVYHFYNAVGSEGRVIALATSKDLKN